MKIPNFRQNKGITLAALVITIIVLLIIATITVTTLSGNNGIVQHTVTAKEESEIKSELKVVDLASNQAKNRNKYGDVTGEELVKALKNNAGENQTEVDYYEKGSLYFVTFKKSNRVYEVTTAGYAKYVGKPEDAVVIIAKPKSSITPKKTQAINVTIKTLLENKIDNLEYVWSKTEDKQPSNDEFLLNSPKALEIISNDNTEKETKIVLPEGTEDGEYYLWLKVTNNGKDEIEHIGPFIIGETSIVLAVDPNGGKWNGNPDITIVKQNTGESLDLQTPTPPEDYVVIFNADGGNLSKNNETSTVSFEEWELEGAGKLEGSIFTFGKGKSIVTAQYSNTKITLPSATKPGYDFSGWYNEEGKNIGNPNDEYKPKSSEILVAHWTKRELVFENQTITKSFGTDSQTTNVTEATNGTGSYKYTKQSEKDSSNNQTTYITVDEDGKMTIAGNMPTGRYTTIIRVTDTNTGFIKDATYTFIINKIDNTLNVTANTITYNAQEQELVSQTGAQGDVYYSIGTELTESNYSEA